jgi:hypothetical protein
VGIKPSFVIRLIEADELLLRLHGGAENNSQQRQVADYLL